MKMKNLRITDNEQTKLIELKITEYIDIAINSIIKLSQESKNP
jgi:hypothetical protein